MTRSTLTKTLGTILLGGVLWAAAMPTPSCRPPHSKVASWTLATLDGAHFALPSGAKPPSLTFDSKEKRVSGFTGCNTLAGSYQQNGTALKFSPLATTRMACEAPLGALESKLLQALEQTTAFHAGCSTLELRHGERVLATFEAVR
jgi:copper homeostasis protein (lipoprotein)